jgi:hypothetical protein
MLTQKEMNPLGHLNAGTQGSRTALQRAGIEFTDQNGAGEGLLLRKRQKRK